MHRSDCFCSTERMKKPSRHEAAEMTALHSSADGLMVTGKELGAETVCTNSLIGQTLQAICDRDVTVV